jgi:hypothetical protein
MKNLLLLIGMIVLVDAQASIEYMPNEQSKATLAEVEKNRSCFRELAVQGCGDPADDQQHFRSCLNNVHSTLSENCKKMMSDLYGSKKL